ncbi:MAG: helix-turn-helix transcriptional regulator [Gemmatimonas sp.]
MFTHVNVAMLLTNVNKACLLMDVNITSMPKPTNSAAVGALIREHREAAGLTQTQLAKRIGASDATKAACSSTA